MGLRQALSRFELSQHVEIARPFSKLVADWFEAKFHYAILVANRFKSGSKLVADKLRTCLRQASNQLRTCLRPASNQLASWTA